MSSDAAFKETEGELATDKDGHSSWLTSRTHRSYQLFGTDERHNQELQFEFFCPLEHAEAVMEATQKVHSRVCERAEQILGKGQDLEVLRGGGLQEFVEKLSGKRKEDRVRRR